MMTMATDHLILHGNNLDDNRGCQALRWCTQKILDRFLPEKARLHANIFENRHPHFSSREVDELSAGQVWETARRGIPSFYFWGSGVLGSRWLGKLPPMRVHAEIPGSAGIILLGGDNLSYDYGLLATLLFFSPLDAAVRAGIPSVVWPSSIGPFDQHPQWEKRFASILRRTDLVIVREPLTRSYLEKLGIEENVRMAADPAFLLPAEPASLPEEIEQVLQAGAIGINLAPLMVRYTRYSKQRWIIKATEIVTGICEKFRLPVLLIPHVMMSPDIFPHNDDYGFMSALRDRLPPEVRRKVWLYDARQEDCRQIKWVISRVRVLVSARFHATVAALSSGVPAISLGYGVKSRGLHLDIFGHDRWQIGPGALNETLLIDRVTELLEAEDEIRAHLLDTVPRHVSEAWKSGEYLKELLARKRIQPVEEQI